MGKNTMNLEWAIWNYFRAHLASKECFFSKALYWRKHSLAFYPLKSGIYKGSCWLSNCSSQKHHTVSSNLSQLLLYLVFCGIIYIYLNWILTWVRGKKEMKRLKKSLIWFACNYFLSKKEKKTLPRAERRTSIPTLYSNKLDLVPVTPETSDNFSSEWTLWWYFEWGKLPVTQNYPTYVKGFKSGQMHFADLHDALIHVRVWLSWHPTSFPWLLPCTLIAAHPGFCLALVSRNLKLGLSKWEKTHCW